MNIAFVTDSTACLPADWFTPSDQVYVVPLSVTIDDETYLEGESIDAAAVAQAHADGKRVTTSRPAPGLFLDVFKEARSRGAEAIVSVHLPGQLSATASAARLAAAESDLLVEVVESGTIGMGLAFAIRSGIEARDGGRPLDEVVRRVRQAADHSRVAVYVDSLDILRRGGRLGRAGALFGTALSIKPILTLKDGKLVPIERVRSTAKAMDRLAKGTIEAVKTHVSERVYVAVHSLARRDLADALLQRLKTELADAGPRVEVVDAGLGAVITAHVGAGTVATVITALPGDDGSEDVDPETVHDARPEAADGE